ncbi:MAG: MtrB/PioB family outer membrane beta-barrel protein, partial [Betaproteobacteria bacterium]
MKTGTFQPIMKASAREVRVALLSAALLVAFSARGADTAQSAPAAPDAPEPEVLELTRPVSAVEVGAGFVDASGDRLKAGDYNGLQRKGLFAIGNLDLRGGGEYYNGDATRWRLDGTNLGLDSRSLSGEYGVQGRYRLTGGFSQLRHITGTSYETPFVNPGSDALLLPAGWVTSASTAGMSGLAASLHRFTVDTMRKRYDFGVQAQLAPQWEATASYRRDTKDGTVLQGAQGPSAFFALRGLLAPMPVGMTTDQFDAGLVFAGKTAQFQIGYYGSLFKNDTNAFTWQSPYDPGTPTQRMSEEPTNQFHQVNVTGGFNFSPTTRITAHGSVGRMTQNETFLPYN